MHLTEKDLSTPGLIFQIGVEPIRIDVLTVIDGVQFDEAWAERMISKFADQPVAVLSKEAIWLALLAVYLIWGSTYLAIRFAVDVED